LHAVRVARLLSLVEPLLRGSCYRMLRYTAVSPSLGGVRVRYGLAAQPLPLPSSNSAAAAAINNNSTSTSSADGFSGWLRGACRSSARTAFVDQVWQRFWCGSHVSWCY
jgi:hypothetical protein